MKINIKGPIVSTNDKFIYDFFGLEAVCPSDVEKALKQANGMPVDIEINSSGGSIFAGNDIYTALRSYQGEVNINIVWAGSAASIIAMAGKSKISPVGQIMIHNVSIAGISGDYHQMDKASEMLQSANKSLAAAYTHKTGKSESEILQMMDKETWLTAEQAVALGFVDSVMFQDLAAAIPGSDILPREVIEKTRKMINNKKQSDLLRAELELLKLGGSYD